MMMTTEFKIIVVEGTMIPDFGKLGSIVRIKFEFGGEEYGTFLRFRTETITEDQIAEASELLMYQATTMLRDLRNGYPEEEEN